MKQTLVVLLSALFISNHVSADQVQDERRYFAVQESVSKSSPLPDQLRDKIVVDALEDLADSDEVPQKIKDNILKTIRQLNTGEFGLAEQIRLVALEKQLSGTSSNLNNVSALVRANYMNLNERTAFELHRRPGLFRGMPLTLQTIQKFPSLQVLKTTAPYNELTAAQVQDLFHKTPDLQKYKNGAYAKVPRIYMFCSHVRPYSCMKVLKDSNGNTVYNADGTLWNQPSLAYTKNNKKFFERSGYTPSGVYEINGVMPAADQQTSFGKYRRLIIDFIPKSKNEINYTYLLPSSHWDQAWWSESKIARDVGRNLFRVHGTGKKNTDPNSTYFPFVPTSGCIAQRENTYSNVTYSDQRKFLDKLMEVSGLEPKYENETKIRALLYVVEVKNTKGAVDLRLLNDLGVR